MQGNTDDGPDPVVAAVAEWRARADAADQARAALIDLVREQAAGGMSEYALARAVGVQRVTIRAWLGKGKQ